MFYINLLLKVLEVLRRGIFIKIIIVMLGGEDIFVLRNVDNLKIKVIFEYCDGMVFILII